MREKKETLLLYVPQVAHVAYSIEYVDDENLRFDW